MDTKINRTFASNISNSIYLFINFLVLHLVKLKYFDIQPRAGAICHMSNQ